MGSATIGFPCISEKAPKCWMCMLACDDLFACSKPLALPRPQVGHDGCTKWIAETPAESVQLLKPWCWKGDVMEIWAKPWSKMHKTSATCGMSTTTSFGTTLLVFVARPIGIAQARLCMSGACVKSLPAVACVCVWYSQ